MYNAINETLNTLTNGNLTVTRYSYQFDNEDGNINAQVEFLTPTTIAEDWRDVGVLYDTQHRNVITEHNLHLVKGALNKYDDNHYRYTYRVYSDI